MTTDPNDAPKGYKAVPEMAPCGCQGCAFQNKGMVVCGHLPCIQEEREDGHSVIFVPEEESNVHRN